MAEFIARRTRKGREMFPSQEQFVVDRLRREWVDAEQAAKRHEFVEKARRAGAAVGKSLLALLLLTGVATVASLAPNAFAAFGRSGAFRRHFKTRSLCAELKKGSSYSYWHYSRVREGEYKVRLTPHGKKVALRAALQGMKLGRQPRWDGIWRVVTFDIARKHDSERAALRRKLLEIGMVRVQDSVFAYPYPCTEEVMFWASLLGITEGVEILEAKFLTGSDSTLRREFTL